MALGSLLIFVPLKIHMKRKTELSPNTCGPVHLSQKIRDQVYLYLPVIMCFIHSRHRAVFLLKIEVLFFLSEENT